MRRDHCFIFSTATKHWNILTNCLVWLHSAIFLSQPVCFHSDSDCGDCTLYAGRLISDAFHSSSLSAYWIIQNLSQNIKTILKFPTSNLRLLHLWVSPISELARRKPFSLWKPSDFCTYPHPCELPSYNCILHSTYSIPFPLYLASKASPGEQCHR